MALPFYSSSKTGQVWFSWTQPLQAPDFLHSLLGEVLVPWYLITGPTSQPLCLRRRGFSPPNSFANLRPHPITHCVAPIACSVFFFFSFLFCLFFFFFPRLPIHLFLIACIFFFFSPLPPPLSAAESCLITFTTVDPARLVTGESTLSRFLLCEDYLDLLGWHGAISQPPPHPVSHTSGPRDRPPHSRKGSSCLAKDPNRRPCALCILASVPVTLYALILSTLRSGLLLSHIKRSPSARPSRPPYRVS